MNCKKIEAIANVANLMSLDPLAAMALPATITVISYKVRMPEDEVINQLKTNEELRKYVRTAINSRLNELAVI